MNTKKVIVAALLLTGMAASANEILFKKDGTLELSGTSSSLLTGSKYKRDVLKLNAKAPSSARAREWNEKEVTGGGLFLNFGLHFPSNNFLAPETYKLGFDFEFGNYFRFAKINDGQFGFGLRATWLSLSYTSRKDEDAVSRAAQISALRIGPQFGMALNETMGVDVFYQIGYNFTNRFISMSMPNNAEDIGYNSMYTGFSHEIGAAFHLKVFSLGLGYRFGKLKNISNIFDGEDLGDAFLDDEKSSVGNFRITLGFKF